MNIFNKQNRPLDLENKAVDIIEKLPLSRWETIRDNDQILSTTSDAKFNNLSITGTISIPSGLTSISSTSITVADNILSLASSNTSDVIDSGWYSKYILNSTNYYAGLFRFANDGHFHLLEQILEEPNTTVNTTASTDGILYCGKLNTSGPIIVDSNSSCQIYSSTANGVLWFGKLYTGSNISGVTMGNYNNTNLIGGMNFNQTAWTHLNCQSTLGINSDSVLTGESYKLDVNGATHLRGLLYGDGDFHIASLGSNMYFNFYKNANVWFGSNSKVNVLIDPSGHTVIGNGNTTLINAAQLSVHGTVEFDSTLNVAGNITANNLASGSYTFLTSAFSNIAFVTNLNGVFQTVGNVTSVDLEFNFKISSNADNASVSASLPNTNTALVMTGGGSFANNGSTGIAFRNGGSIVCTLISGVCNMKFYGTMEGSQIRSDMEYTAHVSFKYTF